MQPTVYLQDLFVDAAMRGIGGGRQLIEAVGNAAREAGATRMYWQTRHDNVVARRLYDRLAKHAGSIVYIYPL
jgi:GNAT superfamily N-acetyltransferase